MDKSDIDWDRIDEAVLALMYLTVHDADRFGLGRAWKSFDWEAMNRLYEKDPDFRSCEQGEVGRAARRGTEAQQGSVPRAVR